MRYGRAKLLFTFNLATRMQTMACAKRKHAYEIAQLKTRKSLRSSPNFPFILCPASWVNSRLCHHLSTFYEYYHILLSFQAKSLRKAILTLNKKSGSLTQ